MRRIILPLSHLIQVLQIHYKGRAKANNAQEGKERSAAKNRWALWRRRGREHRRGRGGRGWKRTMGGSVGEENGRREGICRAMAIPSKESSRNRQW
jgi:hypothetical protein